MPQIARSSSVSIAFTNSCSNPQFPIEVISNWLNRERKTIDQKRQHRCRCLNLFWCSDYENYDANNQIQQLCEFLKQVSFFSICNNTIFYVIIFLSISRGFSVLIFWILEICQRQIPCISFHIQIPISTNSNYTWFCTWSGRRNGDFCERGNKWTTFGFKK